MCLRIGARTWHENKRHGARDASGVRADGCPRRGGADNACMYPTAPAFAAGLAAAVSVPGPADLHAATAHAAEPYAWGPWNAITVFGLFWAAFFVVSWFLTLYTDTRWARWCRSQADRTHSPWGAVMYLLLVIPSLQIAVMGWTTAGKVEPLAELGVQTALIVAVTFAVTRIPMRLGDEGARPPHWLDYDYQRKARGFSDADSPADQSTPAVAARIEPTIRDAGPHAALSAGSARDWLLDAYRESEAGR